MPFLAFGGMMLVVEVSMGEVCPNGAVPPWGYSFLTERVQPSGHHAFPAEGWGFPSLPENQGATKSGTRRPRWGNGFLPEALRTGPQTGGPYAGLSTGPQCQEQTHCPGLLPEKETGRRFGSFPQGCAGDLPEKHSQTHQARRKRFAPPSGTEGSFLKPPHAQGSQWKETAFGGSGFTRCRTR